MRRQGAGFELVVSAGSDEVMVWTASELSALHARAAEWRATLERRGYRVAGAAPRPSDQSSEARAAFRDVIECCDLIARHDRGAAAALRDHATAGLVAAALQDEDLARDAIARARGVLRNLTTVDGDGQYVLASCDALLSRIEATFRSPAA